MALSATTTWELRTAGSDNSGGGFRTGALGIDFSQLDSAFASGTNLTVDAVTNTDVAPDGHTPDADDVGNLIQITAGAGFSTGFYEIASIQSGKWRLDRSPAATGTSGGTWALGGALASPGKLGSGMVTGNDAWIKSGTYTVTSASTNIANGCLSLPAGASAANTTKVFGYGSTRGDNGTKPVITADGTITTFTLVATGTNGHVENIEVNGNSRTSSRGFNSGNFSRFVRCKATNCTNSGFTGASGTFGLLCEATGCSTVGAFFSTGFWMSCVARANSITGFNLSNGGVVVGCVSANNTGASTDGFTSASGGTYYSNCVAYNNGRHGFNPTAASAEMTLVNCLAVSNAGYGFTSSAAFDNIYLFYCAGNNNTSGNVNSSNIPSAQQIGFIALSGDPFTSAAGLDFSLNNTASAGAAVRGAGLPSLSSGLYGLPGLSTNSYPDIGAAQHLEAASAASIIVRRRRQVIVPVVHQHRRKRVVVQKLALVRAGRQKTIHIPPVVQKRRRIVVQTITQNIQQVVVVRKRKVI